MKKFSISMNSKTSNNSNVSKEIIKESVDYVKEQTIAGNYEFFTLIEDESKSFIQTVLEEDGYHVEVRYPHIGVGKGIYVKKIFTYEDAINMFYDFYDRKEINVTGFDDISYYLK